MKDDSLFIHIPKTGGTTLYCALNNTKWITDRSPDKYRHLSHQTKYSECGDIFKTENIAKYNNKVIYTMLRHPIDKVTSEYYFVKDRKEYFSLIKRRPRNIEQYVRNTQTQNLTISFLLGRRFYPESKVTRSDLDRVIDTIESLPIHIAIFEQYEDSLSYLSKLLDAKVKKRIEAKRVTLNRPLLEEIDEDTKNLILESNQYDVELYQHCLEKFNRLDIKQKNYSITKDKYDYVLKYTERFCLLDLYMPHSNFIKINKDALFNIDNFLKRHTTSGREYAENFNIILVNSLLQINSELKGLGNNENSSPLDHLEKIAKAIERSKSINTKKFSPLLSFNKVEKKSFIQKLFGI